MRFYLPGVLQHNHGILNAWDLSQVRLNLTQFDAMPAQLHLAIRAAEEFKAPVWEPLCAIAGEVPHDRWDILRRQDAKALGGQFRTVQITFGDAPARQHQFPLATVRDRAQVLVDHLRSVTGQGSADDAASFVRVARG